MNVTLRQRILFMIGIIALSSLLGNFVLIYNARSFSKRLQVETEKYINKLVLERSKEVGSTMSTMQSKAVDLAQTGQVFHTLAGTTTIDITDLVKQYLMDSFSQFPEAIGGGLWYHPYTLFKDRPYYGPYAYWDKDRVVFTWDLSTPKYDYPNQEWYRTAIPAGWDLSQPRPARVYWTKPYLDQTGTHALMITIDALMYDRQERIIGMATLDLSLDDLQSMVAKMKVSPGSFAFAVDGASGLLTAFPADTTKVMQRVDQFNWGKALVDLEAIQPGVVIQDQLKVNGHLSYLFYTATDTGTILGIVAPRHELYEEILRLDRNNLYISAGVISLQMVLCFFIGLILVQRFCDPITRLTGVAQQIADGRLSEASRSVEQFRKTIGSCVDETGCLLKAFQRMTETLNKLVGQVELSSAQVSSSSRQIAASARQLEATAAEQASSTTEVSATSKEISTTSESLVRTLDKVGETVEETAQMAEAGRTELNKMEEAMRQLMSATGSIASKLAVINERADKISNVVTTIGKISEQTNLLSLNAAIEAEKAGEYGRGFAVVAREISRLSDQTEIATESIAQVVRQMQSSVANGVMEMEKFASEVRLGVRVVAGVGERLGKVIDKVRALAPEFETVAEGMHTHSEGAQQISEAMYQLSLAAGQTRESLQNFKQAADGLDAAVQRLRSEVSLFNIESAAS
ncbi:methyl-accepting chemotaxis protein [Desulfoferrobacter suflitae]|uniref:methyl-accepting chemotaxis protein n=1 Tax=Desulfoferrobacter suflitae TaxID=2865782 RepID=UPI002164C1AF|nr:methyl-accepting chemotaxis protein [Desulfoferrobacter suflitae]MCK8602878.1 methyl-accepting chemotaxis protein [Desulfoferrobacter suflitae]